MLFICTNNITAFSQEISSLIMQNFHLTNPSFQRNILKNVLKQKQLLYIRFEEGRCPMSYIEAWLCRIEERAGVHEVIDGGGESREAPGSESCRLDSGSA